MISNLKLFRQFYLAFPDVVGLQKGYALRSLFPDDGRTGGSEIVDAVRQISDVSRRELKKGYAGRSQSERPPIHHAVRDESWHPGLLHPNRSWTHYRTLLRVEKAEARSFYEIEALQHNWSARELERQINSLLSDRPLQRTEVCAPGAGAGCTPTNSKEVRFETPLF